MRRLTVALLALLSLSACVTTGARVDFPATRVYPPPGGRLAGDLIRPDGAGPWPVVLLLAPCGGVTAHEFDWARRLRERGYASLVVQSLASRGVANACRGEVPLPAHVARDAMAALRWLSAQPGIDVGRAAVIGWSHGASAALDLERIATRDFEFEGWPRPQAVVAYYPSCALLEPATRTPTLLLLAGQDDWTPPQACQQATVDPAIVTQRLYPGALHAFDQALPARVAFGHRMAYDPDATAAAMADTLAFLDRHLRAR